MEKEKVWFSSLNILLLLFLASLIFCLYLAIKFFTSRQVKLTLASHKFAVKRKVIFLVVIVFLLLNLLKAILELGGTKTGPKPTNFKRIRIVVIFLILLTLLGNFLLSLLSKFFLSAEELHSLLQTKIYLFRGKSFQLIGRGKVFFTPWQVKGNLIFQDEKKNVLDVNFVCLAADSKLNYLRDLRKNVKVCPRQKLNWWDWIGVFAVIIAILFIGWCIISLAGF